MNPSIKHAVCVFLGVATFAMLGSGCANLKIASTKLTDVAPEREARQHQIVQNFERRRDESQYRAALASWTRGETGVCESLLTTLLERTPQHREARLALADLYVEQQAFERADEQYRTLLQHDPRDAHVHHCYGMFLEFAGRMPEARAHFAQAAQLKPDDPLFAVDSETDPADPEREVTHASLSDTAASDRPATVPASAESSPAQPEPSPESRQLSSPPPERSDTRDLAAAARTPRGRKLLESAGRQLSAARPDEAEKLFSEAIAAEPDNPRMPITAASLLLRSGQSEAAVRIATPAVDRHPHNVALKRVLGAGQLQSGDTRAAQVTLRQALSLDSRDALTYFLLGCSLAEEGDAAAAEQQFATAHQIDPRFPARR